MFVLFAVWSLPLASANVSLYDKSTNAPIANLQNWTPQLESCGRVVDEHFDLVSAKFRFPRFDTLVEIMGPSDAYLLTRGELVHHNNFREIVLVENVTGMSLDRVKNVLYWSKNGALYNWIDGFVSNLSNSVVEFEVTNGNVVQLFNNQSLAINNEQIRDLQADRICLFPGPEMTPFYEYFIIPLAALLILPCYLYRRTLIAAATVAEQEILE